MSNNAETWNQRNQSPASTAVTPITMIFANVYLIQKSNK